MLKWDRFAGFEAPVYGVTQDLHRNHWLVATHDGIWRVDAEADALTQISLPKVPVTALAAGKRFMFAGAPDGIARSSDNGESWQMVSAEAAQVSQIVLPPNFDQTGMAFAATLTGGMFRSVDLGRSWAYSNRGIGIHSTYAVFLSETFAQDYSLLMANDNGVYASNNIGTNWVSLRFDEDALPVTSFAGGQLCVWVNSESKGVYRLKNSGVVFDQPESLPRGLRMVASARKGEQLLGLLDDGGLSRSEDGGESWQDSGRAPVETVTTLALAGAHALCGGPDGGLWRAKL
jgi:hypothetical protein